MWGRARTPRAAGTTPEGGGRPAEAPGPEGREVATPTEAAPQRERSPRPAPAGSTPAQSGASPEASPTRRRLAAAASGQSGRSRAGAAGGVAGR